MAMEIFRHDNYQKKGMPKTCKLPIRSSRYLRDPCVVLTMSICILDDMKLID